MKRIAAISIAATLAMTSATASFAGGLNEPTEEPPVIIPDVPPSNTGSAGSLGSGGALGILAPAAAAAILLAVALNDDDSD